MDEPIPRFESRSDSELLRLASLQLSLLLSSHVCPGHGDHCQDRYRAGELIEEIGRRYPSVVAASSR